MNIRILGLGVLLTIYACATPSSLDPVTANKLQGFWQQEGYGRVLEINQKKIKIYDITKVSCVPSLTLPVKYIEYIGKVSNLTDRSMTVSGGINHMDFKRLNAMPDICNGNSQVDQDDPVYNFESIWNTFNEQYCAFEKRKVDWDEIYKKYRPKINKGTSDIDLYIGVENMLEELKDGHVGIYTPNNISRKEIEAYVQRKSSSTSTAPPSPTNSELSLAARNTILSKYVEGPHQEYNKRLLRYGRMKNNMVYLQINGMEGWANYDIDNELPNAEFWSSYSKMENKLLDASKKNVDDANRILDEIITANEDAKGYVLDIRFNGGGLDEVALAIMNHFATEAMPVFTKKARKGAGYTRDITAKVTPSQTRFTGPVYVLTSVETASAAEIMSLAAREMSNVTLVGSATEGIFSDILEKQMPNGWEYGLSNEIYTTMDGQDFESVGVPPDHPIKYRRWTRGFFEDITKDLKDGDDAIEKIIELSN